MVLRCWKQHVFVLFPSLFRMFGPCLAFFSVVDTETIFNPLCFEVLVMRCVVVHLDGYLALSNSDASFGTTWQQLYMLGMG